MIILLNSKNQLKQSKKGNKYHHCAGQENFDAFSHVETWLYDSIWWSICKYV